MVSPLRRPTTILVVDDHEWAREALAVLLSPEGYHMEFAASGAEAIAIALDILPDLILLDVMMPNMDGFEVCQRLRSEPTVALVPIILVTALDDSDAIVRGLSAGADDFVVKPYNRAELRARIRTIIRLNRYRLLLEERLRFERLFERSPNGVLIIDSHKNIQLANPSAKDLLAANDDQPLPGANLARFFGEDQRHVLAYAGDILSGASTTARCEAMLRRLDGGRLPVEIDIGDIDWDTGRAIQVILRDITDRKRAELLEEDRRHLAYELHDGVAQLATSAYQHIQIFARRYRSRSAPLRAMLARAEELTQRTVIEVRRVIEGLRPTALDDFGLSGALQMQIETLREQGWTIEYDEQIGDDRLPQAVETALFRIAQEGLANVQKHAQTTHVRISLVRQSASVMLEVQDWGRGFDKNTDSAAKTIGSRVGLRGIVDRAALLGGLATIESQPGAGVRIIVEVPVPVAEETRNAS